MSVQQAAIHSAEGRLGPLCSGADTHLVHQQRSIKTLYQSCQCSARGSYVFIIKSLIKGRMTEPHVFVLLNLLPFQNNKDRG